jgi:FtsH-binding integral membrane protein
MMFQQHESSRGPLGASGYQYQTLPYGYEQEQADRLISKVMLLLALTFLVASIGSVLGFVLLPSLGLMTFWVAAIGGLVVLVILNFTIQVPGWNLLLLNLFAFLEGMSLAPLLDAYLTTGYGDLLGEAFVITALTCLGLAVYAWTTKRDFSRLGDYLFFGLILLLVAAIAGLFFQSLFQTPLVAIGIALVGIVIFCGYVLYYVQRARYMADTLPNAIGLTVSIFVSVLNLFLYVLELLTALGGRRRRG